MNTSSNISGNLAGGRILVVDDETNICSGLGALLQRDGHSVHTVERGQDALGALAMQDCEVAIVDICLPDMSGMDLLRTMHHRWPQVGALVLTGRGTLDTAIDAMREGATDYLLKPVQPAKIREAVTRTLIDVRWRQEQDELLTWLRARLHRLDRLCGEESAGDAGKPCAHWPDAQALVVGELQIDRRNQEVRRGDATIPLTPSEMSLLTMLAQQPGEAVDYGALAQQALGYAAEPWEAKELVKRHIFTLRQKLEPQPDMPHYILNVRGVGYRLQAAGSLPRSHPH
jgi:DNA-binding response OmpR family regulator